MKQLLLLIIASFLVSCQDSQNTINEMEYKRLMKNVAEGWSTRNTEMALNSFDEDAIYMEPPNNQYFRGHEQLKAYFDELTDVHKMEFHNLWFNSETQSGTGEFTFSYGKDTATVGVVVVELENGKIKFWREYLQMGPTNFKAFLSIKNKAWKWHIGNYPEPKDSMQ
ncbi:nuclear transport factor 2 family protein [Flagellimonas flava]|uniref:SnoaL-like domain-containing protein n=1 Tax=Flagellimonas flava TaxID=570519 RepID=A0A1M5KT99_9FLAO|nr:nuclear transport factor 2 family protein [Allomuricauda flava]SHG56092.1 SnoaL-like domain-containing protein [Allomuricauda flava]